MAELTQGMIDAGAAFFDANGVPTKADGTPIAGWGYEGTPVPSGGVLGSIGRQVTPNVPEWQVEQPVDDGRGGAPVDQPLSQQDQAMMGYFGEGAREQAGSSLLNYIGQQSFPDAPAVPNFHPGMTEEAKATMARQNFPVDPNRIVYDGAGNFKLDDMFTGQNLWSVPKDMSLSQIPRSLQLLLGPSVAAWFGAPNDLVARGGAPPWSRYFAPPVGQGPITPEHGWPGIQHYDAWHRSLGDWANLYS